MNFIDLLIITITKKFWQSDKIDQNKFHFFLIPRPVIEGLERMCL